MNVIVLEPTHKKIGYICVPYKHDNFSVSVKDYWTLSKNFSSIYFVTATFSDEIKPYFLYVASILSILSPLPSDEKRTG